MAGKTERVLPPAKVQRGEAKRERQAGRARARTFKAFTIRQGERALQVLIAEVNGR